MVWLPVFRTKDPFRVERPTYPTRVQVSAVACCSSRNCANVLVSNGLPAILLFLMNRDFGGRGVAVFLTSAPNPFKQATCEKRLGIAPVDRLHRPGPMELISPAALRMDYNRRPVPQPQCHRQSRSSYRRARVPHRHGHWVDSHCRPMRILYLGTFLSTARHRVNPPEIRFRTMTPAPHKDEAVRPVGRVPWPVRASRPLPKSTPRSTTPRRRE